MQKAENSSWRVPAILVICALALLPFLPALFSGSVLTFRDHDDYFLPLRAFTASALRHGEMPFWNPFNGSGERWLANPQTGVFYPPTWLFIALPLAAAYPLFLAFHVAIFGIGAYRLFARHASQQAALIATVALLFSGPLLSLFDVNNNLASIAWLPWIVGAALATGRGERYPLALAPLFLALAFLGGEPIFAAIGAAIFTAILLSHGKVRQLALSAAGAAALSAVQLVPFVEALRGSDRTTGLPLSLALKESTSAGDWAAMIVPSVGSATALVWPYLSELFIRTMYAGPLIVVAFVAAFFARERRRLVLTIAAAGAAFAILSAAGNIPLLVRIYPALHLNVFRYPSRLVALVFFAIAWIGAIGIDRIATMKRGGVVAISIAIAAATACAFLLFAHAPAIAIAVAAVDVALTIAVVEQFSRRGIEWRTTILVVAWLAADLLLAGRFYFQSSPSSALTATPFAMNREEKVARYQTTRNRNAVFTLDRASWLFGYSNLFFRQFDAETPAPVVNVRYDQLFSNAIHEPRFDVLDLLSVRYLLTGIDVPSHESKLLAKSGEVRLFERRNAFPAATIWPDALFAANDEEAYARFLRLPDARRQIVVSPSATPSASGQLPTRIYAARAKFASLDRVEIDTSSPVAGILVLNQTTASGWHVTIDGRKGEPLVADGLFRSVAVPAGAHHVVWSYTQPFFVHGALISAIAIILHGGFLLAFRRNREA